jgi:hypothetical protein
MFWSLLQRINYDFNLHLFHYKKFRAFFLYMPYEFNTNDCQEVIHALKMNIWK